MRTRTEYGDDQALLPEMPWIGRARQSAALAGHLPRHAHADAFELVLITQGGVEWFAGDERFELRAGDAFLTHPAEQHGAVNGSLEACDIYWMQFRLAGRARPFGLSARETTGLLERLSCCRRSARYSPRIAAHFEKILAAPRRPGFVRAHALALLDTVVDDLQRPDTAPEADSRIAAAQAWAIIRLGEKLSVAEWADQLEWSETRFYKAFKREVGLSPNDWLTRERIKRGSRMLADPELLITEIAFAAGFSSTQYFSTSFRRLVGCSPSEYRAQQLARHPASG